MYLCIELYKFSRCSNIRIANVQDHDLGISQAIRKLFALTIYVSFYNKQSISSLLAWLYFVRQSFIASLFIAYCYIAVGIETSNMTMI